MGTGTEVKTAASTPSSPASSSSCGKRGRDPEDEVYIDNLHSHKRYLSEIMASSLNGLTVGDHLSENLAESPSRSENMIHFRDDISVQYSPMSEDSDDSRYYESYTNTCSFQPESSPTSPVSPYRCQKSLGGSGSAPSSNISASVSSPQPRQRSSDTDSRFPPSPSDICHSSDLRKAALLRSVQMRAQPLVPSQFELQGTESSNGGMDVEVRACSFMKLNVNDRSYHVSECAPDSTSESEMEEKSCGNSDTEKK